MSVGRVIERMGFKDCQNFWVSSWLNLGGRIRYFELGIYDYLSKSTFCQYSIGVFQSGFTMNRVGGHGDFRPVEGVLKFSRLLKFNRFNGMQRWS